MAWGEDTTVPKNIAKTPLVGGQWTKADGGKFPYDLVIVSNTAHPNIPTGGHVRQISDS